MNSCVTLSAARCLVTRRPVVAAQDRVIPVVVRTVPEGVQQALHARRFAAVRSVVAEEKQINLRLFFCSSCKQPWPGPVVVVVKLSL